MISKDYLNPQNLFGVKILLDPLLLEESVEFQVLVGDAGSDSRLPRNLWKTPQKTPPPPWAGKGLLCAKLLRNFIENNHLNLHDAGLLV